MDMGQVHDRLDLGSGDKEEIAGLTSTIAVIVQSSPLHKKVGRGQLLVGVQTLPINL